MPLFQFHCDSCKVPLDNGEERPLRKVKMLYHSEEASPEVRYCEENFPVCDCGGPMKRDWVYNGVTFQSKGYFPYVEHNFGHDPVVVESYQHRQQLMRERGLQDAIPHRDTAERLHMRWV